jgi:hypothetical protein
MPSTWAFSGLAARAWEFRRDVRAAPEDEIERFGAVLHPDQVVGDLSRSARIVISASVSLSSAKRISTCS